MREDSLKSYKELKREFANKQDRWNIYYVTVSENPQLTPKKTLETNYVNGKKKKKTLIRPNIMSIHKYVHK